MKEEKVIPAEFYSFETNQPFEKCIECSCELLVDEKEYVVEKAFRNYPGFTAKDVIFDYAICMDCAMQIQKRISSESMENIQNYMKRKLSERDFFAEPNQNTCLITNRKSEECTEYQIFAFCRGKHLNESMPAYMISGEIIAELSEILSEQTRDEMNDFMQRHFPTPPHVKEPDPRLIIF